MLSTTSAAASSSSAIPRFAASYDHSSSPSANANTASDYDSTCLLRTRNRKRDEAIRKKAELEVFVCCCCCFPFFPPRHRKNVQSTIHHQYYTYHCDSLNTIENHQTKSSISNIRFIFFITSSPSSPPYSYPSRFRDEFI